MTSSDRSRDMSSSKRGDQAAGGELESIDQGAEAALAASTWVWERQANMQESED